MSPSDPRPGATEATELVVERRTTASAAAVYAHLTSSEGWVRWQGAGAYHDARPGGLFAMDMGNQMRARGQFVELVRDKRVVFTWGWTDHPGIPPGSTVVTIELHDETGTTIRLTHRDLTPDEMDIHRVGWEHYLARLADVAEGGDPGPDPGP